MRVCVWVGCDKSAQISAAEMVHEAADEEEEEEGRGDSALGGQRAKRTRDTSASTRGRATPSVRSARGGGLLAKRVPIIDLTADSACDIDPAVEPPRGPFSSPPAPGVRKGTRSGHADDKLCKRIGSNKHRDRHYPPSPFAVQEEAAEDEALRTQELSPLVAVLGEGSEERGGGMFSSDEDWTDVSCLEEEAGRPFSLSLIAVSQCVVS